MAPPPSGDGIDWPDWRTVPWHEEMGSRGPNGQPTVPGEFKTWMDRNEERAMVRVFVPTSQNGASLPGGYHVPSRGYHFLLVYRSEVPAILRAVPTEEQLTFRRMAERQFEQALAQYAANEMGGDVESARKTFAGSVEGFYHQLTQYDAKLRGGYPAVTAIDVCDVVVPPPENPESAAERAANVAASANERLVNALEGLAGGKRKAG